MIAQHYKTKDLRRIIRLRKKKNYKKLFEECHQLLADVVGNLQKFGNYDFDETYADFTDCATSKQCDAILKEKTPSEIERDQQASEQKG